MKLLYTNEHTTCLNYRSMGDPGFSIKELNEGDTVDNKQQSIQSNHLIFCLEGEVIIRKDDEEETKIRDGEFIFIPIMSHYVGTVVRRCRYLVLSFLHDDISLCDKYMLESYLKDISNYESIFTPLKIRKPLGLYIELLEIYLKAGLNCKHMHEIKERELFIILRASYSKLEMIQLFSPIMSVRLDFKMMILQYKDKVYTRKELAQVLGMSESDLVRKFKQEFHVSIHVWLLKQKNRKIIEMLRDPGTSIKDLVHHFDFSSPASFCRYCKSNFNCTPTELKERISPKK